MVYTLNLVGSALINLALMESPISVAILQCGIVGVKYTFTKLSASLQSM